MSATVTERESLVAFVPGDGVAFVTASTLVLAWGLTTEADGPRCDGADVSNMWDLVRNGTGFEDLAETLVRSGARTGVTIDFALAQSEADAVRVAVSGSLVVELFADGPPPITVSEPMTTGKRHALPSAMTLRGSAVTPPSFRPIFEVLAGVVPAGATHRELLVTAPGDSDGVVAVTRGW